MCILCCCTIMGAMVVDLHLQVLIDPLTVAASNRPIDCGYQFIATDFITFGNAKIYKQNWKTAAMLVYLEIIASMHGDLCEWKKHTTNAPSICHIG